MKLSIFYDHILQAQKQSGKELDEVFAEVRKAGIEAVEVSLSYLQEHPETLELLKNASLRVSSIPGYYQLEKGPEPERAKQHIETAVKAGAHSILIIPGFLSEHEAAILEMHKQDYEKTAAFMEQNEKTKNIAEGLKYLVELGEQAGIYVTVEDFDDRTSPLSCMNGILWYLNQVPGLRFTLDTGNFAYGNEDVLCAMDLMEDRIVHVHCKDRGAEEKKAMSEEKMPEINQGLLPVAVGHGYIPMEKVLGRLKKNHYDGYLAIEHYGNIDHEAYIQASAAFLNKLLNLRNKGQTVRQ